MKYNKKVNKVIIYTLLLLGIINLSVFPGSHAKYFDKKETALAFNTDLYQLNQGETLKINFIEKSGEYVSNYKTAYFKFSFERNDVIKGNKTKDKYLIDLPSACSIISIDTAAEKHSIKNGTITYKSKPENKNNTVMFKCKVNDTILNNDGDISFDVTIREEIGRKDRVEKFTYISGSVFENDYTTTYPIPNFEMTDTHLLLKVKKTPTAAEIAEYYDRFKVWMDTYAGNSGYAKTVTDYVYNTYTEPKNLQESIFIPSNITESNPYPDLPGLTITCQEISGEYIYEYQIDENLIGHARTNKDKDNFLNDNRNVMYFSSTTAEDLESAFNYYVKEYAYPNDPKSYELVRDYVKNNGGIASVILNGNHIDGLDDYEATNKYIVFRDNILDHIFNKNIENKGQSVRISFGSAADMQDVFINDLKYVYGDIISNEAISSLKNIDMLYQVSVVTNSMLPIIAFDDYYTVYDEVNGHFILVNVYSNYNADDKETYYNYATIEVLDYDNNYNITIDGEIVRPNITFTNDFINSQLNIEVTYATEDQLNDVVDGLKDYFKVDLGTPTSLGEGVNQYTINIADLKN